MAGVTVGLGCVVGFLTWLRNRKEEEDDDTRGRVWVLADTNYRRYLVATNAATQEVVNSVIEFEIPPRFFYEASRATSRA